MVVSMSLILEVLNATTVSINRMLVTLAYLAVVVEPGNVVLNIPFTRPCFSPHLGISFFTNPLNSIMYRLVAQKPFPPLSQTPIQASSVQLVENEPLASTIKSR